jgi:hypothetical protein
MPADQSILPPSAECGTKKSGFRYQRCDRVPCPLSKRAGWEYGTRLELPAREASENQIARVRDETQNLTKRAT